MAIPEPPLLVTCTTVVCGYGMYGIVPVQSDIYDADDSASFVHEGEKEGDVVKTITCPNCKSSLKIEGPLSEATDVSQPIVCLFCNAISAVMWPAKSPYVIQPDVIDS